MHVCGTPVKKSKGLLSTQLRRLSVYGEGKGMYLGGRGPGLKAEALLHFLR